MSSYYEVCGCGRSGDLSDREPLGTIAEPCLRCPQCFHLDTIQWLGPEERQRLWLQAYERMAAMDKTMKSRIQCAIAQVPTDTPYKPSS